MKTTGSLIICGGFIVAAACAVVGAQTTRSATEGVYTAEQATRGEGVYKEQCSFCHGDRLEGMGPTPPLAGSDFLIYWEGKTVGELFEKTHTTMPSTAPGTLTTQQAADLVAYMLQVGAYPAGMTELDSRMETLQLIKLDAPMKGAPAATP